MQLLEERRHYQCDLTKAGRAELICKASDTLPVRPAELMRTQVCKSVEKTIRREKY